MSTEKKINIEDIIEHAQEKGLLLPKKQIEFMRIGLEGDKVGAEYLMQIIDRAADVIHQKGLHWEDKTPETIAKEDPAKNHAISKYCDGKGAVEAYIVECTVKNNPDPAKNGVVFYAANRIERGAGEAGTDLHVQVGTRDNKEGLKNSVTAYFNQITINQVKNDMKVEGKNTWKPEKQREMEMSM